MVFLSDYADMCYTHLSWVFRRLNMLPSSRSQNFSCPGSDDGSSSNMIGRWNVSKVTVNKYLRLQKSKHFNIYKFSKKNFGGILRPRSVRRALVMSIFYCAKALGLGTHLGEKVPGCWGRGDGNQSN